MPDPYPTPNLARLARRLADQPDLWEPRVRYATATRHYERLLTGRGYEVWLLTWLPGQRTTWHDHGGSAGAFAVVRGELTEQHALPVGDRTAQIVPRGRRLGAGAVRPFGRRHIHRVTNEGSLPAVSLHVYAPSLTEMHEYEATGSLLRLSRSQLAGVNW